MYSGTLTTIEINGLGQSACSDYTYEIEYVDGVKESGTTNAYSYCALLEKLSDVENQYKKVKKITVEFVR